MMNHKPKTKKSTYVQRTGESNSSTPVRGDIENEVGNIVDENRPQGGGEKRRETGGPSGLEPTRYGDWERRGRCIDF